MKMKLFNWNKIPDRKVAQTVWNGLKLVPVEVGVLEDLFQQPATKQLGLTTKPTKASILDNKRASNVAIVLSQIKLTDDEVKDAILRLDRSVFTVESVRGLAKYAPTSDEIELLKAYQGERSALGRAEQFFLVVMTIPDLVVKLGCFEFVLRFPQLVSGVRPCIASLEAASSQLRTSANFIALLQVVLSLGNFINAGTMRGAACGFKLDSLNKLAETRSTNGKSTLLRYLVYYLENHNPDVLAFPDELLAVADAARQANLVQINADLDEVRTGVKKAVDHAAALILNAEDGLFKSRLAEFVKEATGVLAELEPALDRARASYCSMMEFFAEDPQTPPEEFMAGVNSFAQAITAARAQNKHDAEEEERRKKRVEALRVAASKEVHRPIHPLLPAHRRSGRRVR
eukprot:TRINITY_DN3989_c0_g1_i5.p1 TRINITY_DN3989_c0_g1~~TRINITY_DN3989_c0_g1_i5.p1  ORF type:complete len:402 (+),score=109.77 TRINITY_DN3989_c0_g1_i5:65-1270(+)